MVVIHKHIMRAAIAPTHLGPGLAPTTGNGRKRGAGMGVPSSSPDPLSSIDVYVTTN